MKSADRNNTTQKAENAKIRGMLHLVDFRKPFRQYVRRILLHATLNAIEDKEMAGFALVTWDYHGCCTISFDATHGPIVPRMVPEHVKNAIQGQIQAGDVAWRYQLDDQER